MNRFQILYASLSQNWVAYGTVNIMIMRRIIPVALVLLAAAAGISAEPKQKPAQNNVRTVNRAFSPGEKLTYMISWSKIIDAGIATMEVKSGKTADGRPTFELVSSTHSVGVVEAFYPVRDTVESIVDAEGLYSLEFHLKESHGGRKREREMLFDQAASKVTESVNRGQPETFSVPPGVQDALSSLYYVRTRTDFVIGKAIVIDVHDGGKNWSVEVQILGREKIKTPAGEFDTIKVKTYPKYEGVFTHKGEIYIWFTDDNRKIPVLMKSMISIGSIVATLTEMQGGKEKT